MTTELARMAEVLSRSPSTRNIGTTTELSQNVVARVTKMAVPGGGRRHRGKSGRLRRPGRRRRREWCSGRRKTKCVKGPRAVTSEERTPGSRILYSKTRRVKFNGTRIVSSKLANGKKVVNLLKEPEAEPTAVTGRQDPSPTMIEEGQEGCGGRTEERIPASGVVWKEAPESAIHSVLTGLR